MTTIARRLAQLERRMPPSEPPRDAGLLPPALHEPAAAYKAAHEELMRARGWVARNGAHWPTGRQGGGRRVPADLAELQERHDRAWTAFLAVARQCDGAPAWLTDHAARADRPPAPVLTRPRAQEPDRGDADDLTPRDPFPWGPPPRELIDDLEAAGLLQRH